MPRSNRRRLQPKKSPRSRLRKLLLGAAVVIGAGVASWFGYDYWTVGRFTVSTDDAYVQAYNTTLAAKVAGYVASVPVTDNTYVHAGDVIATIDDVDYRLAVNSAREKVATQTATIARMGHQIAAQEAAVQQAKTQLVSAQAAARRTELELNRQNLLVARDASSRQLQEQAQANRDQAVAGVRGRAGRNRIPRPPMWTCSRASSRKPSPRSMNSRPRLPRPSAICRSPSSARRSTA